MRKVLIALAISAAVIGAGMFAWNAEATTSTAAATLGAMGKNYSPVKKAACYGWGATALRDFAGGVVPTGAGAPLAELIPTACKLFEAAHNRRPRPFDLGQGRSTLQRASQG